MRKVVSISFLILVVTGCSVFRKNNRVTTEMALSENAALDVKKQNLTSDGFFIEKGEIEISSQDINEKFIFNVKFLKPDKYLISLKSRTGIEGARIYISGDSVLVNDRINKIFYIGSSLYLQRHFGFSLNSLPLIVGDIILDKNCEKELEKCLGNKFDLNCLVRGVRIDYIVDCRKRKVLSANQEFTTGQKGAEIKYDDFYNIGDRLIPGRTEIYQQQYNTTIKLRILKVEFPWKGSITFIPGRDYERMELL